MSRRLFTSVRPARGGRKTWSVNRDVNIAIVSRCKIGPTREKPYGCHSQANQKEYEKEGINSGCFIGRIHRNVWLSEHGITAHFPHLGRDSPRFSARSVLDTCEFAQRLG